MFEIQFEIHFSNFYMISTVFLKLFGLQDRVPAAGALPVMHQVYQEVPQASQFSQV